MKKILITLTLLFTIVANANSQNDYNMQRAIESYNEGNLDSAEEFLYKELGVNEKSVQALDLLGYILIQKEDYGNALNMLNNAIKYSKKKEEFKQHAYYHRAALHTILKDTTAAINDYKKSIELNNKHSRSLIELADLYFEQSNFEASTCIFNKMIDQNEGDPYPYYGLARNAYTQKDFVTAENLIDKASLIDNDKERLNIMKTRIYMMREKYDEALETCIQTINANKYNEEAYDALMIISDSLKEKTINRIVKECFTSTEENNWNYILPLVYIKHKNYEEAIERLRILTTGNSEYKSMALYLTADCYDELGMLQQVIETTDKALIINTKDADLYILRADAKFYLQDLDGAESDYRKAMEFDNDYGYFVFYRIGWIYEMRKEYEEALKYYDLGIALNESYAYTYMMKGNLLKDYLNKPEEAVKYLKKCIILDKGINDSNCKQFAYLALGEKEKAIAVNDSILENSQSAGNYYDAACLYSRMNDVEKSVGYLKTALEKGFKKINHIKSDNDLDNTRNNASYIKLIQEYESKHKINSKIKCQKDKVISAVKEFPLRSDGAGSYYINCYVNGFPMEFLLDTGCSDISMSSVEMKYMKKHGIIDDGDYIGKTNYKNASGEIRPAKQYNIKLFKLGDLYFDNVKASVVDNDEAPLLLGQNILSNFGKIEIDHKNSLLKVHITND